MHEVLSVLGVEHVGPDHAGLTLAFEPCMDGNGYPVLEEVSLARRRYATAALRQTCNISFTDRALQFRDAEESEAVA